MINKFCATCHGQNTEHSPDCEFVRRVFAYLDELHFKVVTMYGAAPDLVAAFPTLGIDHARTLIARWMRSYEDRHPDTIVMSYEFWATKKMP